MQRARPSGPNPTPPPAARATTGLAPDIASFRRHLAARNLSPKTERAYIDAAVLFDGFLAREGLRAALPNIRREHVEAFITDQLDLYRPATAHNRYRSLQGVLQVGGRGGDDRDLADGADEAADRRGAAPAHAE